MRIAFQVFAIVVLCASFASADILVREDFSHADGDLVGQTPSPGPGAAWEGHSGGTTNAIQVLSGQAVINQAGGQDANTAFAAQGGATTYSRFDFSLPGATNGDITNLDTAGLYFAHFRDGTAFRARVGVLQPVGGGDFQLVLSDTSDLSNANGTWALWATDLSFDTTYQVVTSFNASTLEAKLWLAPVDASSTSIAYTGTLTGANIDSYALRQSNDYSGQIIVDNLVVATTFQEALTGVPEPGSMAFLLIGGLVGLCKRRRRV